MKILMLTPYVPYPPSSGGQVRTFNLLKYLSKNNQITLVCLYKNPEEKKYINVLKQYCQEIYFCSRPAKPWQMENIFKSIFSLEPFLVVRNFSREAEEILDQLLRKKDFDIIHAETFYVMPHLPRTKIPVFLLEQTIEYRVYEHFVHSLPLILRPFFWFDVFKLKRSEINFWKKADLVGTVSEEDGELITKLIKKKPVVIPNAAGDEMIVKKLPKKDLNHSRILFQGNFYWLQNIEAAQFLIKEIIPLAQKELSNCLFIIAGQNAKKYFQAIRVKNLEIVDINNKDSQKVINLYRQATLFIAPIFGPGGTRLKILAAMASGLPIISTHIGVAGLRLIDGKEVLIANKNKEFIKKIKLVLKNKQLYYSLQENAYRLIKEKYNWQKVAEGLENIYHKVFS